MAIKVKSLRPLAECIGGGNIEVEWTGGTLQELVDYLVKAKGPELEKELMGEDGTLAYLFSVNGRVHRELSTVVHDGDKIFIFAPIGGG